MKIKNLKSEVLIKYYVISLSDKAWISNTSYVSEQVILNKLAKPYIRYEKD